MERQRFPSAEKEPIRIANALLGEAENMLQAMERAWLEMYSKERDGITKDDIERHFQAQRGRTRRELMHDLMNQQGEDGVVLTAKQGKKIVGFVVAKKGEDVHQIHALYVDPASQKRGTGKMLMQRALDFLGDEKDVKVEVLAHNTEAIRFYHSCGFEDTGKLSEKGYIELANHKRASEIMLLRRARHP